MGQFRNHCTTLSIALLMQLIGQCCPAATLTMTFPPFWLPWPMGHTSNNISILGSHDVVLIIDKSYSMAKKDCRHEGSDSAAAPTATEMRKKISRWDWCREQTLDLAKKTGRLMEQGVKVVLFAKTYQVFQSADPEKIQEIFSEHTPHGATKASAALKSEFDQYFERRRQARFHTKPLLLAVITDGCPDEPYKLRNTIVDATQNMIDPAEISIVFLQVGNDGTGTRILNELDNELVNEHARYDIVSVMPFTELNKQGLAQALVAEVASK